MTPHLASGAGQGVEDGLVLATLLASTLEKQGRLLETQGQMLHAIDFCSGATSVRLRVYACRCVSRSKGGPDSCPQQRRH